MKCKKCELEKEDKEFYIGHKVCKKCRVQYIKEWKKNNLDKVKKSEEDCRKKNKEKLKELHRIYREDNRDKIRLAAKKYRESNREKCRKRCLESYHKNPRKNKEWREKNPEKLREYTKKYREKNLEEIKNRRNEWRKENKIHSTREGKARKAIYNALKKNEIVRLPRCQMCNTGCKTEAHHSDYNKPLEVVWVCKTCHGGIHMTLRRSKAALQGTDGISV